MKRHYLTIAVLSALTPNAYSQANQEPTQPTAAVERIEVTGSRIRRVDTETGAPITILRRDEIIKSGALNAAELMTKLTANTNSSYAEAQSADGVFPGFASVSLRGIGEGTTLVLLNGRRLATFAFSGVGTDLGTIPLGAIDRVEVLKDGASAIYGADAVGGVINFILRNDYRGAEVGYTQSAPQRRGGGQKRFTATGGMGDLGSNGYNVLMSLDIAHNDALSARQRDFSRTGYRPEIGLDATSALGTFPANIINPTTGEIFSLDPTGACGPNTVRVGSACSYDTAPFLDLLSKNDKVNFFGRGVAQLGRNHRAFAEVSASRNTLVSVGPPTFVTGGYLAATGLPPLLPESSPYFPAAFAGAGAIPLAFRAEPAGLYLNTDTTNATRAVAGVDGTVLDWDYSAALNRSESRGNVRFDNGLLSFARFNAALQSGLINPFGPSGPAGDAAYRDARIVGEVRRAKSTSTGIDVKVSRDLLKLDGGMLALAVGAEARRETFADRFTDIVANKDAIGYTSPGDTEGQRDVKAVFAELAIPVVKSVELQLAVRHDRYSFAGNSTNPKVSLRWAPSKEWLMRASANTGFRAPSLRETLSAPRSDVTFQQFSDPLRCPTTRLPTDCNATFPYLLGGNRDLKPERSKQFSMGFAAEPVAGWFSSLDFWSIQKEDDIQIVFDQTLFSNFNEFSGSVIRGPVDPAFPTLPGPITLLQLGYKNFGTVKTQGFDVETRYRTSLPGLGQLTLGLRGTYVTRFDRTQGQTTKSSLGRADNGPPVQRWRHSLSLDWAYNAWGVILNNNYIAGYQDEQLLSSGATRRVSTYTTSDLTATYEPIRAFKISLSIKNLLDKQPPASNQFSLLQSGYDPRYSDPRGRTFVLGLNYAFE